jgi:hypothetical protein
MGLLRGGNVNSEVSLRFYPFIAICINPITSGSNWLSETFHGNASFHSFLIIYYIIDLYFSFFFFFLVGKGNLVKGKKRLSLQY